MIIPINNADKALGTHLQQIYRSSQTPTVDQISRNDICDHIKLLSDG